jgi:DNA-binding transcriptional MocR family regulator
MDGEAEQVDWVRHLDPGGGPLYLQIVTAIEEAVARGALRHGDRLPPQRALAQRLDIDLTTVTRAYAEARRRNLLDAVTGRGSFVSARRDRTEPVIDLGMNIPPAPRGIRLAELMKRGLDDLLLRSNADLLMSYHVGAGSQADRSAGASWLEPVLGPVRPERLVVCAGAQAALAAIASMLAKPGDTVLAERLTYPGFLSIASHLGLRVAGLETDAEGIRPDALESACRTQAPRLLYLMPSIQNPTTVTMPEHRRREVAGIAAANGLPIVEDDPYSLLAGDAIPALAVLAPERTYHVATVSKCLTPGFRTAFVVAPEAGSCDRLVTALRALTLMPAPLMTALLTQWIRDGSAKSLLDGVREEAAARQTLAASLLPGTAQAHPGGLHVWQPLPSHWDRYRLIETARREGLGVTPSDAFHVPGRDAGPVPDAVRISLGAVAERARLAAALRTLAAIIGDSRPAHRDIV